MSLPNISTAKNKSPKRPAVLLSLLLVLYGMNIERSLLLALRMDDPGDSCASLDNAWVHLTMEIPLHGWSGVHLQLLLGCVSITKRRLALLMLDQFASAVVVVVAALVEAPNDASGVVVICWMSAGFIGLPPPCWVQNSCPAAMT